MPQPPRSWLVTNVLVVVAAIALLGYSGWRAHAIDITHDEGSTFIEYAEPRTYYEAMTRAETAANHLLNTVAMKAGIDVFGPTPLALRWQSLFAHALYLVVGILWLRRFRSAVVLLCGFVLLNVNPYLLDFFSLARGYGLACAFTLTSAVCLFRLVESGRWGFGALAHLFGALAVLANFSLLHYHVALIGAFNLYVLATAPRGGPAAFVEWVCKRNVPTAVFAIDLAAIVWRPLTELLAKQQLYFGGTKGFWTDTVQSQIYGFLYDYADPAFALPAALGLTEGRALPVLEWFVIGVLALAVLVVAGRVVRRRGPMRTALPYAIVLLVVPALSTVVLFHVNDTRFLLLRTGLFFQVLFMVVATLVVAAAVATPRIRWPGAAVAMLVCAWIVTHTAGRMNATYALDWRKQSSTREMIADVDRDRRARHGGGPVTLAADWRLDVPVQYYKLAENLDWLSLEQFDVWKGTAGIRADYWYCHEADVDRLASPTEALRTYERARAPFLTPPVLRVTRP